MTTMAIPSAMVTATSATSSNRSMASGKEELVKKNEVPATSLTEMVLCPKHLPVPGVGGCGGEYKLSALVPVYSYSWE